MFVCLAVCMHSTCALVILMLKAVRCPFVVQDWCIFSHLNARGGCCCRLIGNYLRIWRQISFVFSCLTCRSVIHGVFLILLNTHIEHYRALCIVKHVVHTDNTSSVIYILCADVNVSEVIQSAVLLNWRGSVCAAVFSKMVKAWPSKVVLTELEPTACW